MELLKRPEIRFTDLALLGGQGDGDSCDVPDPTVAQQLEIEAKYSGYIERQREEIARNRQYEDTVLPEQFDYHSVKGLSNEIKQKLSTSKPETLARASRIPGVTPAAVSLLLVTLKKRGLLTKRIAS